MDFSDEMTDAFLRDGDGTDDRIKTPFREFIRFDGRHWRYSHHEQLPVYVPV